MIEEIVNEDLEKTAKSVKSSDEAVKAVNKMKKGITRNKFNILWSSRRESKECLLFIYFGLQKIKGLILVRNIKTSY